MQPEKPTTQPPATSSNSQQFDPSKIYPDPSTQSQINDKMDLPNSPSTYNNRGKVSLPIAFAVIGGLPTSLSALLWAGFSSNLWYILSLADSVIYLLAAISLLAFSSSSRFIVAIAALGSAGINLHSFSLYSTIEKSYPSISRISQVNGSTKVHLVVEIILQLLVAAYLLSPAAQRALD